ncbi:MAG TPA: bifunctional (p)ppGpp synthetase/guanosine-3',5'-bis(diphosphate) 3'-pyrophosphohydrolase [Hydrogenophilus thermoluteolus]|nr:bifunctional (p)ppGpp synthetase/guanosine-3',5'-bis(diphosphate) 3'-pyrophosphohydrolase [Hydrogenophilus thermoluteolus]
MADAPPPAAAAAPPSRLSPFQPQNIPVTYGALRKTLATYLDAAALARIDDAVHFAAWAHEGQKRASGEPYVTHPIAVAEISAQWHIDDNGIIAALLHDVIEDCGVKKHEIAHRYGTTVAELVDALTKLEKLESQTVEEAQAQNFRKMFLAMARDVRVILIKLADRLHNMRTLSALKSHKRRRIAHETLEIFAPIAHRLGLNALFRELQDLAFAAEHPWRHAVLAAAVETARGANAQLLDELHDAVATALAEWGIHAEIYRREKHLYSIYQKMRQKHLPFEQILDLFGLRIVTTDEPSCYLALGAIHRHFKPIPGKLKDYIALPKPNGYQSLHTTVIGPQGVPLEIQIRTVQQHRFAEQGVAAHWLYKSAEPASDAERQTHAWLQSLLELQAESEAHDFLEAVRIDLYPNEVFVFSPRGEIFSLPRGATAVDFAYAIHSEVGHAAIACRINGELMPLRTELNNGDRVEIITSNTPSPNPAWLNFVRTARARAAIRRFLRQETQEQAVILGERLLDQALRPYGLTLGAISALAWDRLLRQLSGKSKKQLLQEVGLGHRNAIALAELLVAAQDHESGRSGLLKPQPLSRLKVGERADVSITFAPCCRPVPGDDIVGILRQGHGLDIHHSECPIVRRGGKPRWVEVTWSDTIPESRHFPAALTVVARDEIGMLARISAAIAQEGGNIVHVQLDAQPEATTLIQFVIDVRDRVHLARIIKRLRRERGLVRIQRLLANHGERR